MGGGQPTETEPMRVFSPQTCVYSAIFCVSYAHYSRLTALPQMLLLLQLTLLMLLMLLMLSLTLPLALPPLPPRTQVRLYVEETGAAVALAPGEASAPLDFPASEDGLRLPFLTVTEPLPQSRCHRAVPLCPTQGAPGPGPSLSPSLFTSLRSALSLSLSFLPFGPFGWVAPILALRLNPAPCRCISCLSLFFPRPLFRSWNMQQVRVNRLGLFGLVSPRTRLLRTRLQAGATYRLSAASAGGHTEGGVACRPTPRSNLPRHLRVRFFCF